MCRSLVSVGWDGALYDCDFNQMLELPLARGARTIFDLDSLDARRTSRSRPASHCFGCTAGSGLELRWEPGVSAARDRRPRRQRVLRSSRRRPSSRPSRSTTPFGRPSDALTIGQLAGRRVVFLPRHGRGHRLLPSEVNTRANLYALKQLGATHVISVSAVGSLREAIAPGDVVVPRQFIDRTVGAARHVLRRRRRRARQPRRSGVRGRRATRSSPQRAARTRTRPRDGARTCASKARSSARAPSPS